jgi:hypothetical protein
MGCNKGESLGVFEGQSLMLRMTITSVILFTLLVNKKTALVWYFEILLFRPMSKCTTEGESFNALETLKVFSYLPSTSSNWKQYLKLKIT